MQLRALLIENFRGIRHLELALGATTVLVGENNVGKSSVLDSIRLALSRASQRRPLWFDDYDYFVESDTAELGSAGPIRIRLTFQEDAKDEWPDEAVRLLGDVIVQTAADLRLVKFEVRGSFDANTGEVKTEWEFLNETNASLGAKGKKPQTLAALIGLVPYFYLPANRDASREFQKGSTFWGPFLRSPGFDEETRHDFEAELADLNSRVVSAHGEFGTVATALQKSNSVLDIDPAGVSIDAVPRRLSDLLAAAQVNLSVSSGAKLPVSRHGAGTQSLSVVLLFEAYLASKLGQAYKDESEAILGLEEPEAHLHPSAVRSIWHLIANLRGQKIVATHSGELLASVPILDIVRLRRKVDGSVQSYKLAAGTLTPESIARIEFHLKSTRAELLFARSWLIGEGETEYWLLGGVSDILGLEMERHGVRFVNHKWASLEDYLKLANTLGIEWHVLSDGDAQADHQKCNSHLNGRSLTERLTTYAVKDIEVFLAINGFGYIYQAHISPQKTSIITAAQDSNQYWYQVLQAQERGSKPLKMQEVLQVMRGNPTTIPTLISDAIKKAIQLARA